jgi:threonine/homoserine/homoserine lactone efflux protein
MVAVPDSHSLALFAAAAVALLVVPGPAVLYIVAQSAEHGRVAGIVSVAGVHVGTLVHVAAAAVGLSAIVVSSALAFSVVKYVGAAYLVYLGVRRLLERDDQVQLRRREQRLKALFAHGAIVNVLNPKTALFFLAFLPQFVDAEGTVWTQVVVFGLTFVLLGFVSDGFYALAAGTLGSWLRERRRALRYASGSVFIGLGVSAALARRS